MINLPTNTLDHQVKMNKNILERIPRDKISNEIYVITYLQIKIRKKRKSRKNIEKKGETLKY